jgi:hypothetical protein
VEHVLLQCEAYNLERRELLENVKALGQISLTLESLLSFSTLRPPAWKHVMAYPKATGLFDRL